MKADILQLSDGFNCTEDCDFDDAIQDNYRPACTGTFLPRKLWGWES